MLRTANFGDWFAAVFTVNAIFHLVFGLLGILLAVVQPTTFNANGQQTQTVAAALGVLLVMLVAATIINAAASAIGAGLWVGLRRLIFRRNDAAVF